MTRLAPNRQRGSAAGELLMLQLRGLRVDGWVAEYRFHPTRRWWFDVAFPAPEHRLAVEVDGGVWAVWARPTTARSSAPPRSTGGA